ncbi:MAG: hypothetical protein CMQ41_08225 [Gammaproteobacteria bacterium]|nr:hypothetical protein [Gammaproteobacteria bacterium]|tara:strand:- start:1169 stop:1528 length:360 start_codon:yes stop_codon:yes gene_type:complete
MDSDKILMLLMVVVAIIAAFVEIPYTGLALLALGLVSGVLNPAEDFAERTGYLLFAVAAPMVSDNLDLIPAIGMYLNAIIDGIAVAAAGMWVASFTRSLIDRIKPASESSSSSGGGDFS